MLKLATAIGFLTLSLACLAAPATDASKVTGLWLSEPKDGVVDVKILADGTLEGRGAPGAGDPNKLDVNNPDETKRGQKLLGSRILWGFKADNEEKTEWSDGKIYDPANGKTYSCKLHLEDDGTLHIRGYIGISLLGRTTVWTRFVPGERTIASPTK